MTTTANSSCLCQKRETENSDMSSPAKRNQHFPDVVTCRTSSTWKVVMNGVTPHSEGNQKAGNRPGPAEGQTLRIRLH
jgi:hypothetical protein